MQDIPTTTPDMTPEEQDEIYRYWQSRIKAERLAAGAELTRRKYAAMGVDMETTRASLRTFARKLPAGYREP